MFSTNTDRVFNQWNPCLSGPAACLASKDAKVVALLCCKLAPELGGKE